MTEVLCIVNQSNEWLGGGRHHGPCSDRCQAPRRQVINGQSQISVATSPRNTQINQELQSDTWRPLQNKPRNEQSHTDAHLATSTSSAAGSQIL